jgi:L-iditol 2-dehydrogenase
MNYRDRYRDAAGLDKVAIGYTLGGLFAEYILISEEVILTDSLIAYDCSRIPYFAAAFGEPLSCVYSAQNQIPHIFKQGPLAPRKARLGLKKGGVTLILGGGPMGILHADLAMMNKPRLIILSEPIAERRRDAEQILRTKSEERGIELMITDPDNLTGVLAQTTQGRGADDCIVALGTAKVQEQSTGYLAKGGIASFFGGAKLGESLINVDTRRIHYDRISMVGTSGGDPSDVQAVMKLLEAKEVSPGRYVRRVGGLDAALGLVKSIRAQEFFGKGLVYPHVRHSLFPVEAWSLEQENEFLERHVLV